MATIEVDGYEIVGGTVDVTVSWFTDTAAQTAEFDIAANVDGTTLDQQTHSELGTGTEAFTLDISGADVGESVFIDANMIEPEPAFDSLSFDVPVPDIDLNLSVVSASESVIEWEWNITGMTASDGVGVLFTLIGPDGGQVTQFDPFESSYVQNPGPTTQSEINPDSDRTGVVEYELTGSANADSGASATARDSFTVDYGEDSSFSIGYVRDADDDQYPPDSVEIGFGVQGTSSGDVVDFEIRRSNGSLMHAGQEPAQSSASPVVITGIGLDPGESEVVTVDGVLEGYGISDSQSATITYPDPDGTNGGDDGGDGGDDGGDDGGGGTSPGETDVSISCDLQDAEVDSEGRVEIDVTVQNTGDVDARVDFDVIVNETVAVREMDLLLAAGDTTTLTRFFDAPAVDSGEEDFPVELQFISEPF